ncbi:U-box domain-containing protein 9-like [Macadamia integrifolia]|uniref:U-box domain-containing protein 9-like n=1 Tax=Macadamia integrifolia TaxID=60698 RepID=UPI001C527BD0|nr:U-box domain-containing protein 9-like [Macadamia integrifolia]
MAKTGVLETDPAVVAKASELKKELQRLVKKIVDEDDSRFEIFDQANEALSALKDLKLKGSLSLKLDGALDCPDHFRCPLSKELMKDPVILASGQTYDRLYIQKWLKGGNRTCPETEQVLSHVLLTPNYLVKDMISQWCKKQGIEMADPVQGNEDELITQADRKNFELLLEKIKSESISEQKFAAKELRLLTKRMPCYRALFGEFANSIPSLLYPLSLRVVDMHPDLHEDLITTVMNLSIHDSNKKLVAETPKVIPQLIDSLNYGTIETRTNAAAALFTLSALDSNKTLIGKEGALKPLIKLLDEGQPLAMKDAASAIFSLCYVQENKIRAVNDGAVMVILKKIMDRVLVDEMLTILAMLSSHQRAIEEMGENGAVRGLLSIIRESTCKRNQENCIAILYNICFHDRTKWKEMRDEENANGTISELVRTGTSRAKRKANSILERLKKGVSFTHTA